MVCRRKANAAERTWERYLSLVKEANGTKGGFLNVKIRDRKGHKTTDEFKIVVQDLVHDLRVRI